MSGSGGEPKPFLWFTLYELVRLGAGKGSVKVSTGRLAEIMGLSQQSASRHLKMLEAMGLVSRRVDTDGSLINITGEGMGRLEEVHSRLGEALMGGSGELVFEGVVFSGMFQGRYYISQPGYRDQILTGLGFDPFPGTLNVRLRGEYLDGRRVLDGWPAVTIEGFRSDERAFGGARCYPLLVNETVDGALIVADRTGYDLSVMEVIAFLNLREELGLEDGDVVTLTFQGPSRDLPPNADG